MNEEIKEIFNEIKHLVEISNYEEHYHLNDYFEVEHIAKLLNYITNLQEENQELKKIMKKYTMKIVN